MMRQTKLSKKEQADVLFRAFTFLAAAALMAIITLLAILFFTTHKIGYAIASMACLPIAAGVFSVVEKMIDSVLEE